MASVHWQPAGGGGNRDWQLHPAGYTHIFLPSLFAPMFGNFAIMSNYYFLSQILSLRIFSITFVHMSAYVYFVGLCFVHTGRQVNKKG